MGMVTTPSLSLALSPCLSDAERLRATLKSMQNETVALQRKWLPLPGRLFRRLYGFSPGHRGFDSEPFEDGGLSSQSCPNRSPAKSD